VLAYPGCAGKEVAKRVSVCLSYAACIQLVVELYTWGKRERERERETAVLMCCVVRVGVEDDREMQSFESLGMVIFN